jgi:hypothetical protein
MGLPRHGPPTHSKREVVMVCPNCGAQNDAGAKFCAECGVTMPARVAQPPFAPAPAPAAPPPWTAPAPTPAAPTQQQPPAAWSTPPQPQAQAPQQPQQPQAQAAYASPYPQQPPQGYAAQPPYAAYPGAPAAMAPVRTTKATPFVMAGLIAAVGGAVAIASAWLPWVTFAGQGFWKPIDLTGTSDLANGTFLIGGGAVAVVAGMALLLGLVRTRGLTTLAGVAAVVGGALVIAVEAVAYSQHISADVGFGIKPDPGSALYAGIAAGAVAIAGGALALRKPR